ncbi:hypothetical protein JQC67_11410 [Aurantibacter crassamenti]|uniref:hypothetical protein n=1 Tax=Aurantibacter crassamenti TaxID=1837375 RepID=UPI00193A20B0|nr:hypothetical protein [Aurantibacter crassamenti]MBM1106748.1 hypothetical protein [Aurantibacter crassamenti]
MATEQDSENTEKLILIDQNNYSGADSTETIIIRDAKSLKLFYAKVNRARKPGLPVPDIDFTKEIIVIHCSSDMNYSNVNKLIIQDETDTEMVVGLKKMPKTKQEHSSSEDNLLVNPFFVYKIPFTKKKVTIE